MWQVEAIQLLKLFDNDLTIFINKVVTFNTRFEKVEFHKLHKHMLEMGSLDTAQLKEGLEILRQN